MCGYYLAMGMSPDEYWRGSPHLVRYYREAHKLWLAEKNQELWLQGLYNFNAFSAVLSGAFSKGGHRAKYVEKPIDLFPTRREKSIEQLREETANSLDALFQRFGTKEGESNGN